MVDQYFTRVLPVLEKQPVGNAPITLGRSAPVLAILVVFGQTGIYRNLWESVFICESSEVHCIRVSPSTAMYDENFEKGNPAES